MSTMPRWPGVMIAAAFATAMIGCDSTNDDAPDSEPICTSDIALAGAINLDDVIEAPCGSIVYQRYDSMTTVFGALPGHPEGDVRLRLFGLKPTTPAQTVLPAGVAIAQAQVLNQLWDTGWSDGSTCAATVISQQPIDALFTMIEASANCGADLLPFQGSAPPVTVLRFRIRAPYGPTH